MMDGWIARGLWGLGWSRFIALLVGVGFGMCEPRYRYVERRDIRCALNKSIGLGELYELTNS